MFGGYLFPALPPIVIAGTGPNNIVRNNSDTWRSNSSQTSVTSAGSSEKLQPIDIREAPKTVPRVISTVTISSKPSAGPAAPAPAATAPALDPPVASALDSARCTTCPAARLGSGACTDFLGAARDCGGRAGCACLQQHLSRRLPRLRRSLSAALTGSCSKKARPSAMD
jgi:hypothetical protein